uniref:Uncharacterized protein n=1 Tax=Phlebotomus papatasi TaxID=29031 RepID=A0A1B0D1Z8_PHLPP
SFSFPKVVRDTPQKGIGGGGKLIFVPVEKLQLISSKFSVQWSSRADFSNIVGECDITEWNGFQGTMGATCRIGDLTQGRRYFFRACLGNVKGYGQYRTSCPSSVVPSSWYDVEQRENRFVGRQRVLDDLFAAVRLARPEDASNIPLETPALQRRNPKKKTTIKQLFSAASKFQKNLRREEWEFLKGRKSTIMFGPQNEQPTEVQQLFLEDLTIAAHRLFKYMDTPTDDALKHRLYDVEVIELNADVSFLVICPPPEFSCAVPGQREILLQRGDLLSLPLQAFEMIHLRTYQNGIIQKYSRLSCILELDTVLANHSHREAFSTVEVQAAKERLCKLQELSMSLNAIWKGVRWLMDVISFARDRTCMPALGMRDILECQEVRDSQVEETKRQLLQPPPRDSKLMKSSPGRGSWPGPAISMWLVEGSTMSSRYLSATSEFDASSRKNSADSNYSHSGHSYYSVNCEGSHIGTRLPPSRSEDTLNVSKKQPHRKRTTTINTSFSAASSPLLNIRPTYTGTTDSVHSLSSDSESASYPVLTSTPHKVSPRPQKMQPSVSMTNVKNVEEDAPIGVVRSRKQIFEPDPSTSTAPMFLKTTLSAIQSDSRIVREPLHIAEESLTIEQPFFLAPGPSAGTATRSENRRQIFESAPAGHIQSSSANKNTHEKATSRDPESSTKATEASSETVGQPGIIQVYAAYDTGLASGTSLKLHVTPKTTAREVIDLVVKQLNMAVVLKGREGPIYTADKLENFCLVAVIGARERCLRDDFKPLQLQNPWKKGRLYVRQKHDLLAAIEHSNRDAQMI